MTSPARVIVIGGGVIGAGARYHLAKTGRSGVALVERCDLISGLTYHAAACCRSST